MRLIRPVRVSCVLGEKGMGYKSGQIVEWLVQTQPLVRKNGFRAAIRKQVSNCPEVDDAMRGFKPDAFAILPDTQEIHIIEVIDTSPVTFDKGELLAYFAEIMDDVEWSVSVVAYDYTGGLIGHIPAIFFAPYYTQKFKGQEMRDVVPAALAAYRANGPDSSVMGMPRWLSAQDRAQSSR